MKKRHISLLLVSILTLAAAGGMFYYLHQTTEARPPQNHREAREKRPKNKQGKGQTKKKKQPAAENKASGSKGSVAPTPPEKASAPEEAPTIPSELSQEEKDNRLYDAARKGNASLVRQYLAAGANPNRWLPRWAAYPIFGAVENGHTDCLRILLDSGAAPDIGIDRNPIFLTAIFRAARNGHADCLEVLIKAGAGINVVKGDITPLHLAAENGHTQCVALLIRAGAKLDVPKGCRTTALYEATRKGHIECAKMLLAAGANPTDGNPNAISLGRDIPGLREAMRKAETECNIQALDKGLSQQEKNDRLAQAVNNGNAILVRRYLADGADVKAVLNAQTRFDERDPENAEAIFKMLMEADGGASADYFNLEHPNTRLFLAAGQGDTELVKKLMKEGADIHATNSMNQWTPLHHAAIRGHEDCLMLLLKAGAKVNQPDRFGRTPLYWAAFNSHTECVKMLLKAKADAKSADSDNRTALYWAAERGNADCVKMLIKAGADIEQCGTKGRPRYINGEDLREHYSPLYWTALWGHADCMKLLIEAGADVNKDTNSRPALHLAAQGGYADCVKLLLEAGADVNKVAKFDEHTPLYYAAWEGHEECVRLLLNAPGIDVNKDKATLSDAIRNGHTACVRLLLSAPGINLNQSLREHNPLRMAFGRGDLECAKLLLNARGLDMNRAVNDAIEQGIWPWARYYDESQRTKIFELLIAHPSADINRTGALVAAATIGHEGYVKMCLDKPGTDVNIKNKNGEFPLLAAAYNNKVGCLSLLLDAPGIDVNAGAGQWTALHGAVANNSIVCVELLLNAKGIDVNAASSTGDTALHQAVAKDYSKMFEGYARQGDRRYINKWGQATCVRLLLNAQGIDVNKVNKKGQTALWLAVFNNNVECVRLLLNAPGININQPDAAGKSPLDLASEKKHDECLKLLREAAKH